MSYPTDGRNHHNAIKQEKSINRFKTQYENYYKKEIKDFIHLGGTKDVVDFQIIFLDGSIVKKTLKKKNNILSGSFDYINTSDFPKSLIKKSQEIYNKFKSNRSELKKQLLIDAISYDLINLDRNELYRIVNDKVIDKYNKIGGLDIVEVSTDKLFINVTPFFFSILKNGGYLKVRDNGKKQMSYMLDIYDSNDKLLPETGLRIRLHLNNGWSKWYEGKSSILVIKLQQDKVFKILK